MEEIAHRGIRASLPRGGRDLREGGDREGAGGITGSDRGFEVRAEEVFSPGSGLS